MATSNVVINVRSNLLQVAEHLRQIAGVSKQAMTSLDPFVKKTDESITGATRNSLTSLQRLRGLAGSIAKKMGDDFKAMFSAVGISQGLKMGGIFATSAKEAFQLSDQIRKLSSIFGLAEDRFVAFQTKLVKGLGDIGISSEAATNALKGLSETQVRGEEALVEYSKLAGQLASISQQPGQEGAIAAGIAGVITERGGNPSDVNEAKTVAEDIRKAVSATGLKPTEILTGMQELFRTMSADFKKSISTQGLMQLAVIQKSGGANTTKFIQDIMQTSTLRRQVTNVRGFENIFSEKGLNVDKFRAAMKKTMALIPQDAQLALETVFQSEETAKGMLQLYNSLDAVDKAQKKVQSDNKSLNQVYFESMGAMEAFTGSLNKFKSSLSEQISTATNWLTDALKKGMNASLSDVAKALLPEDIAKKFTEVEKNLPDVIGKNLGSTAVVGGAALASTMMFGGGLNAVGGLLRGKTLGVGEKKASEQLFGKEAIPVYVVNTGEIGQAVAGSSTNGAGLLGSAGKYIAAAGVGVAAYNAAPVLNDIIKENQPEIFNKADQIIDDFFQKLMNFVVNPRVQVVQVTPSGYGKTPQNGIDYSKTQPGLAPNSNQPKGTRPQ